MSCLLIVSLQSFESSGSRRQPICVLESLGVSCIEILLQSPFSSFSSHESKTMLVNVVFSNVLLTYPTHT